MVEDDKTKNNSLRGLYRSRDYHQRFDFCLRHIGASNSNPDAFAG